MKTLVVIAIFAITTTAFAEILSFPSFQIEVENGWTHSIESGTRSRTETGDLIEIRHPISNGILKIQQYNAPEPVKSDSLRNLTNVDLTIPLAWQNWGDYSGYQYDYSAADSFYRQWWLAHESTILFVVYESKAESSAIETDEINKIVNSLRTVAH